MTKLDLQKELLEKIKLGTKPSNIKKKPQEKNSQIPTPPDSPIMVPVDKKSQPRPSKKSISPPPISIDDGYESDISIKKPSSLPEAKQVKDLKRDVEYWSQTANTHLKNLQAAMARITNLEEQLKKNPHPERISEAAEQALMEANQKIRELEAKIQAGEQKYSELEKQAKNPANNKQKPVENLKTFLCSDCQQTKSQTELSRVFGDFKFCLACSKQARQQAQQEKISPEPPDFICHACQQTKQEIPNKMKLDQTLQTHLICSPCRPNLKEFNEADLITDDLWAKYPYSSASEILEKEFGIKKEEGW